MRFAFYYSLAWGVVVVLAAVLSSLVTVAACGFVMMLDCNVAGLVAVLSACFGLACWYAAARKFLDMI